MADVPKIVVLEGDETGQELLDQALLVLRPEVIGIELDLDRYDLSLEHRRATANAVVVDAARAMREAGYGVKAATVTPEGKDDVGSPNRLIREEIGGKVIVRTGRRIPGVVPLGGVLFCTKGRVEVVVRWKGSHNIDLGNRYIKARGFNNTAGG